ncbi:hypothetical protein BJ742DRAFT_784537 [Cladochytrium replicatum]|nr:hypothetical protein BJ742DRAFT_784537 [Cladochytrium replicatum]
MEWMRALECASAGGCPLPNEDLDEDVIAIYGERDSCLSRRMFPKPAGVGQMDVLEWWKASGLPLHSKLSLACGSPMDWASEYGCVNALEWWKHSGWSIRLYTENSMDGASKRGHIEALEWWKSSGLELKYSHYAMDEASIAGRVEVLEWWRKSGLELKWSDRALATEKGTSLGYLWWKSKLILRLD